MIFKSNSHLNIKSYDKALGGTRSSRLGGVLRSILKSTTTPFKALFSLKPIKPLLNLLDRLNFLNKAPFGVAVVFWLGVITIVILVANKLRYEFFVDLITKNFPEAVSVAVDSTGKPLYMSQLDRMFAEFNAINNVGYLVFFAIILRTFLRTVWASYNPRKVQVLGRM